MTASAVLDPMRTPPVAMTGGAMGSGADSGQAAPESKVLLSVQDLGFAYPNGTVAIDGLDFDIRAGRISGIVGPSGCGKSTLLHLLSGLSSPSKGRMVRAEPDSPGRHFLTMVFQQDTLHPWLRVIDNVKLYFSYHPHDAREIDERVKWLLELVGLADAASLYPYQLSGGMRRRVAFIAAIAPFPQVLLLDEPFSSLDEPTRVAIHQDVYDTVRRLGIATVIVTHDLAEAASLCDEVTIFSARPARIAAREEIPFGASREILSLRKEPEFLSMYGKLWDILSRQILLGREASKGKGRPS
jgi:ABC-type nitrate/sulfonate/bicarbonate transport system ATPase subunit